MHTQARVVLIPILLVGFLPELTAQGRQAPRDWELTCARGDYRNSDRERACTIIERTMAMPGGTLTVDGRLNGGIRVIGESRRDVVIRAKFEAHAGTQDRAKELIEEVRVRTEGGRITADGPEAGRREWWAVSYEIRAPASADLDLRAHNGGIAVAGVTGMMRMETLNGGIHLEAVNGDVVAETTNGGLHVSLEGESWKGKGLDATTTNGGVHLRVPAGYSAQLTTGTVNGGMDIDFPVTLQGRIGKRMTVTLGEGGAPLRLMTTNGGVEVRRR